jgi:hypothetical protein
MKLLVCLKCNDVFNLNYEKKTCSCEQTWGKYFSDGLHAEYGGPCLPLGFANGSFETALLNQPEKDWGKEFTAFVIQKECPTMKRVGEAPVIPKRESRDEMMKRIMDEMLTEQILKKPLDNPAQKRETEKVSKRAPKAKKK